MKNRKLKNRELGRKSPREFKKASKTPVTVVLDNIRSSHNVGSVFRTADAFLVEKIYLCGITASPPHRDIRKTAIGASETVDWEYVKDAADLVNRLKEKGKTMISLEQSENSTALQDLKLPKGEEVVLVFGNEVKGVQQEIVSKSDVVAEIPQYGSKHSLNISVSAGIAIWEVFQKINFNKQ